MKFIKIASIIITILLFAVNGILQSKNEGTKVGKIKQVNKSTGEIIVGSPTSGKDIIMGDLLYVRIDGKIVLLRATYPMQTIAKCKAEGKNHYMWKRAESGIPVFRWEKGIDDDQKSEVILYENFSGIEMVLISGKNNISQFYMGKFEVTQKQYVDVTGKNPSHFAGSGRDISKYPVDNVNWYSAVVFCNKLSEKAGFKPYYNIDKENRDPENKNKYDKIKWTVKINEASNGFRLPTSAEWEHACRAGTTTTYYWGNSKEFSVVDKYAVYDKNSSKKGVGHIDYGPHRVGTKKPNSWGLYDMSGNLLEWCFDWHPDANQNLEAWSGRAWSGGSWDRDADDLGSGGNGNLDPSVEYESMGFRLARTL